MKSYHSAYKAKADYCAIQFLTASKIEITVYGTCCVLSPFLIQRQHWLPKTSACQHDIEQYSSQTK